MFHESQLKIYLIHMNNNSSEASLKDKPKVRNGKG